MNALHDWPRLPTVVVICVLSVLGALFLHFVGISALMQESGFQFYADSLTYYQILMPQWGGADVELMQFAKNFLGPWVVLRLTGGGWYNVMLFNVCLFGLSVELLADVFQARRGLLYLILLANPLTLSSLMSVNKEILSLLAMAIMMCSLARRTLPWIALGMATALMVRWQFVVFLLLALVAFSRFNPWRDRRLLFVLALLLLASLALFFSASMVSSYNGLNLDMQAYEGSGVFRVLVWMQQVGLYWLVFVPKALHLMFGLGLRLDRLFAPADIYNDVWQLLHSTAMLMVAAMVFLRRQVSLRNDPVYLAVLYLAVFVASPIYVPRYYYPVYVMLAVCLSAPRVIFSQSSSNPTMPDRSTSVEGVA